MSDEDRPPEEIWLDNDAINEHFERVKARWHEGRSTSGDMEPIEEVELVSNEYTRDLRKKLKG